jgi:hypothetical protein
MFKCRSGLAERCPKAEHEVSAVIIELGGTVNMGDAGRDRTLRLRDLR